MLPPLSSPYTPGSTPWELLSELTSVFLVAKSIGLFSVFILSDLSAVFENVDFPLFFWNPQFYVSPFWVFSSFLFHSLEVRLWRVCLWSSPLISAHLLHPPISSHCCSYQTCSLASLLSSRALLPEASLIYPSGYDLQNCKLMIWKEDLVSSKFMLSISLFVMFYLDTTYII